jgi:hypothetical protein
VSPLLEILDRDYVVSRRAGDLESTKRKLFGNSTVG